MSLSNRYYEVIPINSVEYQVNRLHPSRKDAIFTGSKRDAIQYVKDRGRFMAKSESAVGRHNGIPDSEFDLEQLKIGIEEEMEHTDDPEIAKNIAKDHLYSDPDYYKKLKKFVEEKIHMSKDILLEKVRAGIMDESVLLEVELSDEEKDRVRFQISNLRTKLSRATGSSKAAIQKQITDLQRKYGVRAARFKSNGSHYSSTWSKSPNSNKIVHTVTHIPTGQTFVKAHPASVDTAKIDAAVSAGKHNMKSYQ